MRVLPNLLGKVDGVALLVKADGPVLTLVVIEAVRGEGADT